ncbi:hypothetical protein CsSME_00026246 [Camellia sinensis var. sinensis]
MADSDHSTEDTSGDSRDDNNSHQGSELQFSEDEETLIIRMFNLVGERWSLIAGRIPGRTAEEIEKYWNSSSSSTAKKLSSILCSQQGFKEITGPASLEAKGTFASQLHPNIQISSPRRPQEKEKEELISSLYYNSSSCINIANRPRFDL